MPSTPTAGCGRRCGRGSTGPAATSWTSAAGPASTCRGSPRTRRPSPVSNPTPTWWRSPGVVPGPCPTSPCTKGLAQALPLPDASVDVVHARWAYFFGPGCEPGLAELDRVVRRGGVALVIDNDPTRSTFGAWFRRGYPKVPEAATVERFWSTRGWTRTPVDMGWRFSSRADLESVVRIEFDRETAEAILAGHEGTEVDYAVNLWSKATSDAVSLQHRRPQSVEQRLGPAASPPRKSSPARGPAAGRSRGPPGAIGHLDLESAIGGALGVLLARPQGA